MWFYIMMFICNLLIPILMLICGFFMSKYPPKEINGIIGYRTTMSRKIWIHGSLRMITAVGCGLKSDWCY